MRSLNSFLLILVFSSFFTGPSFALPIDWHGAFGVDTTVIQNYRRIESTQDRTSSTGGSQEVEGIGGGTDVQENSHFQTALFRLEPHLIVNDSVTIKGEFSNGYARGDRLGQNGTVANRPGMGNALYPHNFSSGQDAIIVNQLHMELFSETATYLIGRHSHEFGLGALFNDGSELWDRNAYIRDGITAKIQLGSFKFIPYWSRVSSTGGLSRATRIKEFGIELTYDSAERDLEFGILYGKKSSTPLSQDYFTTADESTDTTCASSGDNVACRALGKANADIVDIYVKKTWGIFDIGVEVPIMGGEVGNYHQDVTSTPDTRSETRYKAKAVVAETQARIDESWTVGFHFGLVDGEDGIKQTYEALYLNPNYQVGHLLFRYNLNAMAGNETEGQNSSVFDSYVTNTTYLKGFVNYKTDEWIWNFAFLYASANEVAKAGLDGYNHEENLSFNAAFDQEDDLGLELDIDFTYLWNDEISISGTFAYLFTGEYYAFTNTSETNTVTDTYLVQLRIGVEF